MSDKSSRIIDTTPSEILHDPYSTASTQKYTQNSNTEPTPSQAISTMHSPNEQLKLNPNLPGTAKILEILNSPTLVPDKNPEERLIDKTARSKTLFYLFGSLPFVAWFTRTMTMPSTEYHPVFVRGAIMRFRPWTKVGFGMSLLVTLAVCMVQVQVVEMLALTKRVREYAQLNTERGRELRKVLREVGEYDRYVSADSKIRYAGETHAEQV